MRIILFIAFFLNTISFCMDNTLDISEKLQQSQIKKLKISDTLKEILDQRKLYVLKAFQAGRIDEAFEFIKNNKNILAAIDRKLPRTPIHTAAETGNVKLLKKWLTICKCPPNIATKNSQTLLHYACKGNKNRDSITMLLQKFQADPNRQDIYGNTPLHEAVRKRNKEEVSILLDNKAEPNIQNIYGDTPLHLLKSPQGDTGIAAMLLINGARLAIKNKKGETTVHAMATKLSINELDIMIKIPDETFKNIRTQKDNYGNTPLHYLIMQCKLPFIVSKLAKKDSLNISNNKGKKPLDLMIDLFYKLLESQKINIAITIRKMISEWKELGATASKPINLPSIRILQEFNDVT